MVPPSVACALVCLLGVVLHTSALPPALRPRDIQDKLMSPSQPTEYERPQRDPLLAESSDDIETMITQVHDFQNWEPLHQRKKPTLNETNPLLPLTDDYVSTESSSDEGSISSDRGTKKHEDIAGMSQHFFPSFAPLFSPPQPINPSYPYLFQEQAHSHRPPLLRPQHNVFQPLAFGGPVREQKYIQAPASPQSVKSTGVLGSGNFGIIRGGTFYGDARGDLNEYSSGETHNTYSPYYQNGHGRPEFYNGASNPRPQQQHGNDFFANFRDFADINTPTKSSYSELFVVYMNKNATIPHGEPLKDLRETPKMTMKKAAKIDQDDSSIYKTKLSSAKRKKATEKHLKKSFPSKKRKTVLLNK